MTARLRHHCGARQRSSDDDGSPGDSLGLEHGRKDSLTSLLGQPNRSGEKLGHGNGLDVEQVEAGVPPGGIDHGGNGRTRVGQSDVVAHSSRLRIARSCSAPARTADRPDRGRRSTPGRPRSDPGTTRAASPRSVKPTSPPSSMPHFLRSSAGRLVWLRETFALRGGHPVHCRSGLTTRHAGRRRRQGPTFAPLRASRPCRPLQTPLSPRTVPWETGDEVMKEAPQWHKTGKGGHR